MARSGFDNVAYGAQTSEVEYKGPVENHLHTHVFFSSHAVLFQSSSPQRRQCSSSHTCRAVLPRGSLRLWNLPPTHTYNSPTTMYITLFFSFVTALIYLILKIGPSLVVVSRLPWPGWPHHATHTHQTGVGNQPRPGLAKGADVTHSPASPPGLARGSCERIPPPRANKKANFAPPVASRSHVQ